VVDARCNQEAFIRLLLLNAIPHPEQPTPKVTCDDARLGAANVKWVDTIEPQQVL